MIIYPNGCQPLVKPHVRWFHHVHPFPQQLADNLSRLLVLADSFFKLWQFCGIETLEMILVKHGAGLLGFGSFWRQGLKIKTCNFVGYCSYRYCCSNISDRTSCASPTCWPSRDGLIQQHTVLKLAKSVMLLRSGTSYPFGPVVAACLAKILPHPHVYINHISTSAGVFSSVFLLFF